MCSWSTPSLRVGATKIASLLLICKFAFAIGEVLICEGSTMKSGPGVCAAVKKAHYLGNGMGTGKLTSPDSGSPVPSQDVRRVPDGGKPSVSVVAV